MSVLVIQALLEIHMKFVDHKPEQLVHKLNAEMAQNAEKLVHQLNVFVQSVILEIHILAVAISMNVLKIHVEQIQFV